MNLEKFLQGYPDVLFSDEGDEVFITLRLMLNGMCSFRTAKLLNYAASFLNENEYYLEIGTFAGYTLLSAAYESGRKFIGIDNFTEKYSIGGDGGVKARLVENLGKFPGANTVIDSDFRKADLSGLTKGDKAGVFLIDGKHIYEDVMDSISWAMPHLADEALIVFDDVNVPGVRKAIENIRLDHRFSEFFFANSFHDNKADRGMSSSRHIHNGISLMTYKKEGVLHV